jgi:hypothetical protein
MDTKEQLQELHRELSTARREQADRHWWTICAILFVGSGGLGMLMDLPWTGIIVCAIAIGALVLVGYIIRAAILWASRHNPEADLGYPIALVVWALIMGLYIGLS